MLLHYLAKLKTRKLYLFMWMFHVDLPIDTQSHRSYHIITVTLLFIYKTIACVHQRWNRVVRVTGHRVNILGRAGSGHWSVSNTHDPVFWPRFGTTKMYFLSTGALSLSGVWLKRHWYCKASAMLYTHAVNGRKIARWDFNNILG